MCKCPSILVDAHEQHPFLLAKWKHGENLIKEINNSLMCGRCHEILELLAAGKRGLRFVEMDLIEEIKKIQKEVYNQ